MGQSSSAPHDHSSGTQDEVRASGVTLAPELEADIVRDFTNRAVQDEWTRFRASVLSRQEERLRRLSEIEQRRRRERELAGAQQRQRMQDLDSHLDGLNARFADAAVAIEHDARALYRTLQSPNGGKSRASVPCLGPRAHWMDCATKYQDDTRPCDAYLAALEKCVQETVVRLATGGGGGEGDAADAASASSPPPAASA